MKPLQLGLILVALGAIVFELDAIRRSAMGAPNSSAKEAPTYWYIAVTNQHDFLRNLLPSQEIDQKVKEGFEYCGTFTTTGANGLEVHAVMRKRQS